MIVDPGKPCELLQGRLTLSTEIAVVEVAHVVRIADTGIVNARIPVAAKLAIVLSADQPTSAVIIRKFVFVFVVVADPAAVEFPIANVVAQPAKLTLM